jgi:hypothetical protein
MANLGRVYPRAFNRDFSWRDFANRFQYLANRIMIEMSGTQWAALGWPTEMMQSADAVADFPGGRILWDFGNRSTIYPTSTFKVWWELTGDITFWRPRWQVYVSSTLNYTNTQRPSTTFPVSWPQAFATGWIDRFGNPVSNMNIAQQRAAIWADY